MKQLTLDFGSGSSTNESALCQETRADSSADLPDPKEKPENGIVLDGTRWFEKRRKEHSSKVNDRVVALSEKWWRNTN